MIKVPVWFWWEPSSTLQKQLFVASSHSRKRVRKLSGVSLIRALIPFMRAHHLITFQRLHLLTPWHGRLGFQHMDLTGTHALRPISVHSCSSFSHSGFPQENPVFPWTHISSSRVYSCHLPSPRPHDRNWRARMNKPRCYTKWAHSLQGGNGPWACKAACWEPSP